MVRAARPRARPRAHGQPRLEPQHALVPRPRRVLLRASRAALRRHVFECRVFSTGRFRRRRRPSRAPGVRPASFHATDAADLSRHGAYYSPYTLQLATRWLRRDLEALGYPPRT